MEVLSGDVNSLVENRNENFTGQNVSQDGENSQGESEIKQEVFNQKKNKFRIEVRNKKIRTFLQAKRMKGVADTNEALPIYFPEIIDQTYNEFHVANPNLNLIQQNLKVIRKEIDINSQDVVFAIKNSKLFMKLVLMITWGRDQPYEISYHIVLSVSFSFECQEMSEELVDILLRSDKNGQIDDRQNNEFYQKEKFDQYRLCPLEDHLKNDDEMDIRDSAIMLLANLAAENSQLIVRAILSKGMLFHIIWENLVENNYSSEMLESIVNLISNLSRKEDWFTYADFVDLPKLLEVLFPLVKDIPIVNTTLLNAMKKIFYAADDDEIHSIVNYNFDLVTNMNIFVIDADLHDGYVCDCIANILEIFDIFCSQFESLTLQVVEIGVFDAINYILQSSAPNELILLALQVLETCFAKNSHIINDRFLLDTSINPNQALTKKIISYAAICQADLKNSALMVLSTLLGNTTQSQCSLFFDDKLMKLMLESLLSDSIRPDSIKSILNSLANVIFIGNIDYSPEENPYVISFLNLHGDAILDKIQDSLSDDAYFHSERLMDLILKGNYDHLE